MQTDSERAAQARNPFFNVLGRGLEAALNRLVALDPETRTRLGALEGRALSIDFQSALPPLAIAVEDRRLRVGPAREITSALRVCATPASLLALALSRGRGGIAPGRVEIAGDAELARRLEEIATRFQPDFDEAFTRVFGDVAGMKIAQALRDGFAWTRRSARSFAKDGAEYLSEESRDLVARAEADGFFDEVDALRDRTERLAARLRRLDSSRHA